MFVPASLLNSNGSKPKNRAFGNRSNRLSSGRTWTAKPRLPLLLLLRLMMANKTRLQSQRRVVTRRGIWRAVWCCRASWKRSSARSSDSRRGDNWVNTQRSKRRAKLSSNATSCVYLFPMRGVGQCATNNRKLSCRSNASTPLDCVESVDRFKQSVAQVERAFVDSLRS